MTGYWTLSEYCKEYGLNSSRIRDYFEKGNLPDAKQVKNGLYFPEWMYKYNHKIIRNTNKITNIYTAIMKAVNKEIHLNYKMCKTNKMKFQSYLDYLVSQDVIHLQNSDNPSRVESYLPTMKLLKDTKFDYYKLATFLYESSLKGVETASSMAKS